MKFPSFIRLPRNKRFEFTPRYYDPIKEEVEERREIIRRELKGSADDSEGYVPRKIKFERKVERVPNTSFLQIVIAAVLGGGVMGWLYYGNDVIYALLIVIVPVYIYFRFGKRLFKKQ